MNITEYYRILQNMEPLPKRKCTKCKVLLPIVEFKKKRDGEYTKLCNQCREKQNQLKKQKSKGELSPESKSFLDYHHQKMETDPDYRKAFNAQRSLTFKRNLCNPDFVRKFYMKSKGARFRRQSVDNEYHPFDYFSKDEQEKIINETVEINIRLYKDLL